jgi:outer membrane protein assembly factor BamB
MSGNINHQTHELDERVLTFDIIKGLLYCRTDDALIWVKKINDVSNVLDIQEDQSSYYLSCALDDIEGEMLCIDKKDGNTKWFIPGKPFFQKLFDKYLYTIFMDTAEQHYLLKIDLNDGSTIWHHRIDNDLSEYILATDRIELTYSSGRIEKLAVKTGTIIYQSQEKTDA